MTVGVILLRAPLRMTVGVILLRAPLRMTACVILRSMATKDLIACGKGAVNGKACRAAEFRVGGTKHGTCYK